MNHVKLRFQRSATRIGMFVPMAILLCHSSMAFAGTILGTAQSFAVLGSSTVTNTGSSTISGDVGVSPGSAITGFPPGVLFNGGGLHISDGVANQGRVDETNAYNTLAGLSTLNNLSGQNLGGMTLLPGVYRFTSDAFLTGATTALSTLTLDFNNLPNALFVFQIGAALTTGSSSTVNVINGTATDGIFWQVGTSATLGTSTTFAGNILALQSVTLNTSAKILCGRAFAQNGAVTLDSNVISGNCGVNAFGSGRSDFGSGGYSPTSSLQITTPEPGTFLLLGVSLIGFAVKFSARRK